ncbi:hypothetical protein NP493_256g04004 [Ridgeia piscesae]|uniref:PNT domain-containing protein n=1 Tax=Ridgeia piscesae TaxID=27915 RepID=A0AAD9NYC8_RIDPI|nr:hypothetical protein NP493_256g04004 [Ridgeia piscesae]
MVKRHMKYDFFDALHPRDWSRPDVHAWLLHMRDHHDMQDVQCERFPMNGKALCLMSVDMFRQRVPGGGKLLYRDFQLRLGRAMTVAV